MRSRMEFEVLEQLGDQLERLPAESTRRGSFRVSSSAAVVMALCVGVVGTASAATVIVARSAGDDPAAEVRRELKTPRPAPAEPAATYSALADGEVHDGPPVAGAHVTVNGNRRGGCIRVLIEGDLGPAASCFTEQNLQAKPIWNTVGGLLIVLVPDAATDITIEVRDGSRQRTAATNNLVVATTSDKVEYTVDGKIMKVQATKSPS
jgi:hypothetical protein